MDLPDWQAHPGGARIRAALWLAAEVGVGGVFTKSDLRDAFPSVGQIDRRVRDLRAEGWVIATSREDLALSPDEQRLVTIGGQIWQPGYQSHAPKAISDRERQAVLSAAGYHCVICGVSAGDTFPDDPVRTARLGVQRLPAATGTHRLRSVCDRCHTAASGDELGSGVVDAVAALSGEEAALLASWVTRGSRPISNAEAVWALYRRSPEVDRREARRALGLADDGADN